MVVVKKKGEGSLDQCHVALVEDSDGETRTWRVVYGDLLIDSPLFHANPGFGGLVSASLCLT